MNPEVFLPYGLDEKKEMVHISEVRSGKTSLSCPFCGAPLMAKKGTRLTHHFAHKKETCKEVLTGDAGKMVPNIPFYLDFFSHELSASERQVVKLLHEKFGSRLFHRKGQADSAFHLMFQADTPKISQVWENLVSHGHVQQRGNWYHLTKLAELGLAQLPIKEFAEIQTQRLHFFEAFLATGNSHLDTLRKKVYDNLKTRILDAHLYCIHIPGGQTEPDVWKIGITTRSAKHRLQELMPLIKHRFGTDRATKASIILELATWGKLEAYIKKRFSSSNLPIEYKGQVYTEFFTSPLLQKELLAFSTKT